MYYKKISAFCSYAYEHFPVNSRIRLQIHNALLIFPVFKPNKLLDFHRHAPNLIALSHNPSFISSSAAREIAAPRGGPSVITQNLDLDIWKRIL